MIYIVQKDKIKHTLKDEIQLSAFLNSGYNLVKTLDNDGKEIKEKA